MQDDGCESLHPQFDWSTIGKRTINSLAINSSIPPVYLLTVQRISKKCSSTTDDTCEHDHRSTPISTCIHIASIQSQQPMRQCILCQVHRVIIQQYIGFRSIMSISPSIAANDNQTISYGCNMLFATIRVAIVLHENVDVLISFEHIDVCQHHWPIFSIDPKKWWCWCCLLRMFWSMRYAYLSPHRREWSYACRFWLLKNANSSFSTNQIVMRPSRSMWTRAKLFGDIFRSNFHCFDIRTMYPAELYKLILCANIVINWFYSISGLSYWLMMCNVIAIIGRRLRKRISELAQEVAARYAGKLRWVFAPSSWAKHGISL